MRIDTSYLREKALARRDTSGFTEKIEAGVGDSGWCNIVDADTVLALLAWADQAQSLLERMVAAYQGVGHRMTPIDDKDIEIVRRANEAERGRSQRSLRCWDCDEVGDRPIGPGSDRTWGDEWHERVEARKAAMAFLEPTPESVGGSSSDSDHGGAPPESRG